MIEAPAITCRHHEESVGFKHPSHFSQGLFRGMEVRHHTNSQDKAKDVIRKRKAVCIPQTGQNRGTHPSTSYRFSRGIQHVRDGVHRLHEITALSQCDAAKSAPASDFENLFSQRHCQLIDPFQNGRQALPIDFSLDTGFLVNVSPLSRVRLEMLIDDFLVLGVARNIDPNPRQLID